MTNHVHLLATPSDQYGISRMMQSLGRRYVAYVNATYARTGTLWEGRYKSTLVDSEHYVLVVSRYIELNPVRALMVDHPSTYPWSSYHGNALGKDIKILTPHSVYKALGKSQEQRLSAYRSLFAGRMAEKALDEIRECTNKSWALGSDKFKKQIEKAANRRVRSLGHGGDRKSKASGYNQGV